MRYGEQATASQVHTHGPTRPAADKSTPSARGTSLAPPCLPNNACGRNPFGVGRPHAWQQSRPLPVPCVRASIKQTCGRVHACAKPQQVARSLCAWLACAAASHALQCLPQHSMAAQHGCTGTPIQSVLQSGRLTRTRQLTSRTDGQNSGSPARHARREHRLPCSSRRGMLPHSTAQQAHDAPAGIRPHTRARMAARAAYHT